MVDEKYLAALPDAACGKDDIDPNLFFDKTREADAKAICVTCPIVAICAEYALKNHMTLGVWGGLTDDDRKKLWKKYKR